MHKVQYISPFQANYDLSKSNKSIIRYLELKDKVVFEWKDLLLEHHEELGFFDFQATLYKNNDIVFAYKKIPINAEMFTKSKNDDDFKAGISDAFQKGIHLYGYHKIDVNLGEKFHLLD